MFNSFLDKYGSFEPKLNRSSQLPERFSTVIGAKELLEKYEGQSFGNGIYRLFQSTEIENWNEIVLGIFSQFKGCIDCFAIDWLGRVFAWDYSKNKVLSLDPGFGEAMIIPCSFVELHNVEFVEYSDESLSSNFYEECIVKYDERAGKEKCFGYKVSPFLGGEDSVENLELVDPEVYWSISTDIYNSVKNQ